MSACFDALIIGGGPAGATAGILLASVGWRVVLIEKASFPRRKVCGEFISATSFPLLDQLGVLDLFEARAGPEVRRVGLFARDVSLIAPMPRAPQSESGWGRALGREHLDLLLLERAAATGAEVLQPWSVTDLIQAPSTGSGSGQGRPFVVRAVGPGKRVVREICASIVIAAHGSWEPGALPTQLRRSPARAADLFGFKAHFVGAALAPDLMPLLVFPGGYGGMVWSDAGRVSLSCCLRRDWLERLRGAAAQQSAAEAVLGHLQRSCSAVRAALSSARRAGDWLAAGPIRPGIRRDVPAGMFRVGNAAGEAHPIVAEGISMAMQSAWLLCQRLTAEAGEGGRRPDWERVRRAYQLDWQTLFGPRLHAASLFAEWALHPGAAAIGLTLLRWFPSLLGQAAKWSGKSQGLLQCS